MITSLADLYDRYEITEPERKRIEILSQEVYESTREGVSVTTLENDTGIKLSTIVEGTDAEWSTALTFPFSADELEGAFLASQEWADEIREPGENVNGTERYVLTERDVAALLKAVEVLAETGHDNEYAGELDHLALMLSTAVDVEITYVGPEAD